MRNKNDYVNRFMKWFPAIQRNKKFFLVSDDFVVFEMREIPLKPYT